MPRRHSSDGQELQRVPLVRADCERDFQRKFGRRMTELEEIFLHRGNETLDRMDEGIPENTTCAFIIERAVRICDHSRDAIDRAVRIAETSKDLVARTHVLRWQARQRGHRTSPTIQDEKIRKGA